MGFDAENQILYISGPGIREINLNTKSVKQLYKRMGVMWIHFDPIFHIEDKLHIIDRSRHTHCIFDKKSNQLQDLHTPAMPGHWGRSGWYLKSKNAFYVTFGESEGGSQILQFSINDNKWS